MSFRRLHPLNNTGHLEACTMATTTAIASTIRPAWLPLLLLYHQKQHPLPHTTGKRVNWGRLIDSLSGANYIIRICILLVICQNVNFLQVCCSLLSEAARIHAGFARLLAVRHWRNAGVSLRVNKFEPLPRAGAAIKVRYNFPQLFPWFALHSMETVPCILLFLFSRLTQQLKV